MPGLVMHKLGHIISLSFFSSFVLSKDFIVSISFLCKSWICGGLLALNVIAVWKRYFCFKAAATEPFPSSSWRAVS